MRENVTYGGVGGIIKLGIPTNTSIRSQLTNNTNGTPCIPEFQLYVIRLLPKPFTNMEHIYWIHVKTFVIVG